MALCGVVTDFLAGNLVSTPRRGWVECKGVLPFGLLPTSHSQIRLECPSSLSNRQRVVRGVCFDSPKQGGMYDPMLGLPR